MTTASLASIAVAITVAVSAVAVAWGLPGREREPAARNAALEGLRGVLATAVVAHHLLLMRNLARTGHWRQPADDLGQLLGRGAVALFFVLSAYLFCGAIARNGGRFDFIHFWRGRVWRILPAWFFAFAILLVVIGFETGWRLQVPLLTLARQIGAWAFFASDKLPDINGRKEGYVILSVSWSLNWEMRFYLLLPLLAFAWRRAGMLGIVMLLLLPACFGSVMWPYFAAGAAAAWIGKRRLPLGIGWWVPGIAGMATLLLLGVPHSWLAALLLLPAMVAAVQSSGPFGLLAAAPLTRLGRASYSLYLLHNPVTYLLVMRAIGAGTSAGLGDAAYCGVAVIATVLSVLAAFASYRWIERPFLDEPRTTVPSPPVERNSVAALG